jgi:Skp family chaperone for outer membrane proteins
MPRLRALSAALALTLAAPAAAEEFVVVDLERALGESAAARTLAEIEASERQALRARLDALREELEARESELVELREAAERGELTQQAFDDRVRAFDRRVRGERAAAQEAAAALQERFRAARAAMRGELEPALSQIMRQRGAELALDARQVVAASPGRDVTDALIAALDARLPPAAAARLLPAP